MWSMTPGDYSACKRQVNRAIHSLLDNDNSLPTKQRCLEKWQERAIVAQYTGSYLVRNDNGQQLVKSDWTTRSSWELAIMANICVSDRRWIAALIYHRLQRDFEKAPRNVYWDALAIRKYVRGWNASRLLALVETIISTATAQPRYMSYGGL